MPKLAYHNTTAALLDDVHGRHRKDMIVLHETVSPDVKGWDDIDGVVAYLDSKGYGIHGLTDAEGHIAWALGLGNAIFYQAGGVNERSIGIEQVSKVMLQSPSNAVRAQIWAAREPQLRATAKLVAVAADAQGVPLVYSNGTTPGVTTHWDVSQHYPSSDGHSDCWPRHKGGYYPVLEVLRLAKVYAKRGYAF